MFYGVGLNLGNREVVTAGSSSSLAVTAVTRGERFEVPAPRSGRGKGCRGGTQAQEGSLPGGQGWHVREAWRSWSGEAGVQ